MKKNIILILSLSAVMLTGCDKENELIDKLETSEITYSEQLTQIYETEKRIIETEGDTQFIFGGETETSADVTENTENGYSTDNISVKYFDYGSLATLTEDREETYGNNFIKDNVLGVNFGVLPADFGSTQFQLRFYDISENKQLAVIDFPETWGMYEQIIKGSGDVLCKQVIYTNGGNALNNQFAVITVYNDFTYDISDGYTPQDVSFECCGHNIAEWENDIVDTDSGGILESVDTI